jgi:tRNA threonylcarbamoyladenosine biosynthesis protein TsaE
VEVLSGSPGDTEILGEFLGGMAAAGDVLGLEGELGAGKSVMVRGLARGLGYRGPVTSPTFVIIQTYPEVRLCHVDAFRLEGARDLLDAGVEEYLDGWIVAVEWADRVREALPCAMLAVRITGGPKEESRKIELQGGTAWERRLKILATCLREAD